MEVDNDDWENLWKIEEARAKRRLAAEGGGDLTCFAERRSSHASYNLGQSALPWWLVGTNLEDHAIRGFQSDL